MGRFCVTVSGLLSPVDTRHRTEVDGFSLVNTSDTPKLSSPLTLEFYHQKRNLLYAAYFYEIPLFQPIAAFVAPLKCCEPVDKMPPVGMRVCLRGPTQLVEATEVQP